MISLSLEIPILQNILVSSIYFLLVIYMYIPYI